MPAFLIPLVIQLIASLPQLIQIAEQAFSGQTGSGAAKKQLVIAGAQSVMNVVSTVGKQPIAPEHQSAILGSISALTDAAVSVFNTAGLFKKG